MVMDGHEFEGTNITPMSDWIWYKNYSWKIMVNSPVSGRFTGGTNPERFWMWSPTTKVMTWKQKPTTSWDISSVHNIEYGTMAICPAKTAVWVMSMKSSQGYLVALNMWVCLKIGYTPQIQWLIMISTGQKNRGTLFPDSSPCGPKPPHVFMAIYHGSLYPLVN